MLQPQRIRPHIELCGLIADGQLVPTVEDEPVNGARAIRHALLLLRSAEHGRDALPIGTDNLLSDLSRVAKRALRRILRDVAAHFEPLQATLTFDALLAEVQKGDSSLWDTLADAVAEVGQAAGQEQQAAPPDDRPRIDKESALEPAPLLLSWREITDALGRPNTQEFRNALIRLSEQYDGPLVKPGRGGQPKVHREKLVAWWNGLEARMAELDARKRDQEETVKNQYLHGSDGEVVPDIAGGVKRPRGGST